MPRPTRLTRLTMITYPTAASTPAFPGAESLDDRAMSQCRAVSIPDGQRADTVVRAPEQAARQAAEALELTPVIADELGAPQLGRWAGLTLSDVAAAEPEGLSAWMSDPHWCPHEGESLAAFTTRVGTWLDQLADGRTLAVVHAITARAAVAHALEAGPLTIMHVDVAPLGLVALTRTDRWRLQRLNRLERTPTTARPTNA